MLRRALLVFAAFLAPHIATADDSSLGMSDAALEYSYHFMQAYQLASQPHGQLADCGLSYHLAANQVFNTYPQERIGIKMMSLSGIFRQAGAIHLAQNPDSEGTPSSPFMTLLMQKMNEDEGSAYKTVLSKVEECGVLLSQSSEAVDAMIEGKETP